MHAQINTNINAKNWWKKFVYFGNKQECTTFHRPASVATNQTKNCSETL